MLLALGCEELPRRGGETQSEVVQSVRCKTLLRCQIEGSRDLKLGTILAAVRQLGIDWDDA